MPFSWNNVEDVVDLQARPRCATPKQDMTPGVVRKEKKKAAKKLSEKQFRDVVWDRDEQTCRATGKPLKRAGTDWNRVGHVHHRLQRSTNPDRVTDPTIGVLLSRHAHELAETPCPGDVSHCLLDIEGPEDMALPHDFVFRDKDGKEKRRRTS